MSDELKDPSTGNEYSYLNQLLGSKNLGELFAVYLQTDPSKISPDALEQINSSTLGMASTLISEARIDDLAKMAESLKDVIEKLPAEISDPIASQFEAKVLELKTPEVYNDLMNIGTPNEMAPVLYFLQHPTYIAEVLPDQGVGAYNSEIMPLLNNYAAQKVIEKATSIDLNKDIEASADNVSEELKPYDAIDTDASGAVETRTLLATMLGKMLEQAEKEAAIDALEQALTSNSELNAKFMDFKEMLEKRLDFRKDEQI